jgi:streptomycin 6-kinase
MDVPGARAAPRRRRRVRARLTARFGSDVAPWLDELPGVLTALAQRWQCELGAPIQRGSLSAVFPCRLLADGRRAVLKVSPDRPRLALEAAALSSWHGMHTPSVIAVDQRLGALLIEAIEPGLPLAASCCYPALDGVVELLRSLHGGGATDPSFPAVAQRVAHLYDSSTKLYARHPRLTALVPPDLYERGHRLATSLAHYDAPAVLLHGDLTPGNILDAGGARGLVAIDPAPCLGDAAFDAVDLILWQAADLPTIDARCRGLAAATGVAGGRYVAWCVAFAAMAALESGSDGDGRSARIDTLLALAARA